MTLNEAIERCTRNAEYARTHRILQGCLDFKQLAWWLNDYKKLLGAIEGIKADIRKQNIADFIAVQSVLDIINKHASGKENE